MTGEAPPFCTGILLAAGRGRRFDPEGVQNKLMQRLPDGELVAIRCAKTLSQVVPTTVVVVRADAVSLTAAFREAGFATIVCPDADTGMAHSLVHALRSVGHAPGWIISLADMPAVQPATISALDAAIRAGADIAVPVCRQRRGNPVGFSRRHYDALLQLQGDRGAQRLLLQCPVTEVEVDDPGIFLDIDRPDDLRQFD